MKNRTSLSTSAKLSIIYTLLACALLALASTASAQTRLRRTASEQVSSERADAVLVSQVQKPLLPVINDNVKAFATLSDEEFSNWIGTVQYRTLPTASQQQEWTTSYVNYVGAPTVENGEQLYRLRERTAKLFKLFRRENALRFIVFKSPVPFTSSVSGTCIGISTGMLESLESEDELIAVVAHELAHEFSDVEFSKAVEAENFQRTRELELTCDAIATRALHSLGLNPRALGSILFKTITWDARYMKDNDGTGRHPNLATRLYQNEQISSALKSAPGQTDYRTLVERASNR